jgi:hypothetical protein
MALAQPTLNASTLLSRIQTQSPNFTNVYVIVSGTRINASVVSSSFSFTDAGSYYDFKWTVKLSFTSNGGTLEKIHIESAIFSTGSVAVAWAIESTENYNVPSGTTQITKTYIVRWYKSVQQFT